MQQREQVQSSQNGFWQFFTTGVFMKSVGKFVGAVAASLLATCGNAFAAPCDPGQACNVPEPTSLALVTVAIAGALWVARKKK